METISIRVDEELFKQLEEERGDRSKSDFYRDVIKEHLNTDEGNLSYEAGEKLGEALKQINELKSDLSQKNVINQLNAERIKDLQKQLGWIQFEYSKLNDRLLLPAPEKKWWKFWK